MKKLQIFLLVLIIIGIGALVTQKIWVPKLVSKIISFQGVRPVTSSPKPQDIVTLGDGRQCYTYSHEATTDAPYKVNELLDITITGGQVVGTKTGTQSGPDMTNGYTGKISGTLENNIIRDVFAYVVEGSSNKEREIYRASKTGIEKMRYPLIEQGGMLVPDTTKEFSALSYARVECKGSN